MESRVFVFALASRICLFVLQAFFDVLIPDHDAQIFQFPVEKDTKILDPVATFFLSGFRRWDAQYFLHIAQYGYTYENTLAFFPLLPLLVRMVFYPLSPVLLLVLSTHNCFLLIGVSLNIFLFGISSVALYRLTLLIFKHKSFAFKSSLLFCLNPASIFFSAVYSESLFSALTFTGLLFLQEGCVFKSVVLLGLSAATRSNGILSVGFIIYSEIRQLLLKISIIHCNFTVHLISSLLKLFCLTLFFLLPFAAYQKFAYSSYCFPNLSNFPKIVKNYAHTQGYKIAGSSISDWCHWKLPLSYSYVQKHYWNVGFLQYYEVKQIPNFILAFPILLIIICSSLNYFKKNSELIRHLGLYHYAEMYPSVHKSGRMFVYFSHALVLAIICTVFSHVQISTRLFASSSPLLYWIIASLTAQLEDIPENKTCSSSVVRDFYYLHKSIMDSSSSSYAKLAFYYFISYIVLGTLLHVNHLPWT